VPPQGRRRYPRHRRARRGPGAAEVPRRGDDFPADLVGGSVPQAPGRPRHRVAGGPRAARTGRPARTGAEQRLSIPGKQRRAGRRRGGAAGDRAASFCLKGLAMLDDLKEEAIVNKVGGRFKLSTLIQKRMVALNTGARPLVDLKTTDKMAIVVQEI